MSVNFYTLKVQCLEQELLKEDLHYDGIMAYQIDEEEVDRILGDKAFSGGDVDEQTIALIEQKLADQGVTIFFHGDNGLERCQKAQKHLQSLGISFEFQTESEQDWNEKWREGYKTVEISKKLWVIPSWEKETTQVPAGVLPLYLYPGQGFGTGRHETTELCLRLFESHISKVTSVLDFGCGSGILGIAAALKFKSQVDYLDIDASALENTKQNLEINHLPIREQELILRNQFKAKKTYELVFANILLDILVLEKPAIVSSLASGSKLIVSGLLREHARSFRDNYSELKEISYVELNDWCAILLEKP